ncbi:MAG: metal-dependent hydrolase [Gammaproteobacteria bacterium]|nr:metal-dependent hydrolase [Gammaproteobacteria bacterium]
MANFNTHLFWAGSFSSLAAVATTKLIDLPANETLLLTALGTIGGILPDIDLRHSTPSQMLFTMFGAIASLCWLFANVLDYSALSLWGFSALVFLIIRYPVWWAFHQFTVHRGALHSLAAALMFALITAALTFHIFDRSSTVSWICSTFVFCGYVVHLVLDEIYSVDFMGIRIKRTFGSALKLIDMERWMASVTILVVCMATWFVTPDPIDAINTWKTADEEWRTLLLPEWLQEKF